MKSSFKSIPADLWEAIAELMARNAASEAHLAHIQALAAEARRTGESQRHRIQHPTVIDYGGPIQRICAIGKRLGIEPRP